MIGGGVSMKTTEQKIVDQIEANPVLIYMKGIPEMPQCGFSATAVNALNGTGVLYAYVNVLESPCIREKLPTISNWPTFPQLFVNGELVGGSDIIAELAEAGVLKSMVEDAMARLEETLSESH